MTLPVACNITEVTKRTRHEFPSKPQAWLSEPVASLDQEEGRLYLGHAGLGCFLFQKGQDCFHVALTGCDVQGRVPSSGGQVGVGIVFQQELHHVCVADASCTVKWGLVILDPEAKAKKKKC